MEAMAQIDTCPPSELSGLMARAKKQITHLFQIKALYLAIKQQEAQLRALVEAGTGSRAPAVAPKQPAPAKPAAAAAARPAPASAAAKPADYSALAAMNAKLHNALARLESVVCGAPPSQRGTQRLRFEREGISVVERAGQGGAAVRCVERLQGVGVSV
jgi:hypothetical protein